MAWFDILAGVGEGLGQATQNFQQQLLLQRQREDQLRKEAEERRRFELLQQQSARDEARVMAGERRAEEQFLLNKEQALAQDVERVLSTYEGEPIPDEVVQWAAKQSPRVAQALLVKTPEGGFTRRLSAAERRAQEDRAFAQRKRAVEEPLLADQERILKTPDVSTLPLQDRKLAAKMRGLDENAYLTNREKIEDAKTSQNYLVTQLAATLAAARQNTITPEQQRLLNAQTDALNKEAQRVARMEEQQFQKEWKELVDARYGNGRPGSGRPRWEAYLKSLPPALQTKAKLDLINEVRIGLGHEPTTNPVYRLNPTIERYDRPYPTIGGKSVGGVTIRPGSLRDPLAGVATPSTPGTTMTLPDGTTVRVSP